MTDRKPIFDAFRTFMGGTLTKAETNDLDAFLDRYRPRITGERAVSDKSIALIKEFEGCAKRRPDGSIEAYRDVAGVWTIGWGATRIAGRPVQPNDVLTQAEADELLVEDIERHAQDVRKLLGDAPTSQNQFDALVSFHFNTGGLGKSTLLKRHKAGLFEDAANWFEPWNKAGGKVVAGLTRRRLAEAKLYRGER